MNLAARNVNKTCPAPSYGLEFKGKLGNERQASVRVTPHYSRLRCVRRRPTDCVRGFIKAVDCFVFRGPDHPARANEAAETWLASGVEPEPESGERSCTKNSYNHNDLRPKRMGDIPH